MMSIRMGYSGIRMECSGIRIQRSTVCSEYLDAENMHPDGIFWHPDTPRGIRIRGAGCTGGEGCRERNDEFSVYKYINI